MALEVGAQPDICVRARGVVVEVQERLAVTVEDAWAPLDETWDGAQLVEQRTEPFEGGPSGVLHDGGLTEREW